MNNDASNKIEIAYRELRAAEGKLAYQCLVFKMPYEELRDYVRQRFSDALGDGGVELSAMAYQEQLKVVKRLTDLTECPINLTMSAKELCEPGVRKLRRAKAKLQQRG